MPVILKKCFLYHYDPSINSDKVFNLFLLENENGTYSALQEYGRSETKLNVKTLAENCSLSLANSRFSEKRSEKVFHKKTPYSETFNCSYSPTLKKFAVKANPTQPAQPAKILDFKPLEQYQPTAPPTEAKESGKQRAEEKAEKRSKQIGVLNLNQLDALEL